jgi:hypothetical protein
VNTRRVTPVRFRAGVTQFDRMLAVAVRSFLDEIEVRVGEPTPAT